MAPLKTAAVAFATSVHPIIHQYIRAHPATDVQTVSKSTQPDSFSHIDAIADLAVSNLARSRSDDPTMAGQTPDAARKAASRTGSCRVQRKDSLAKSSAGG